MSDRFLGSVCIPAIILAGLTCTPPALAQDASAQDASGEASEGIGDIIVTAQKRSESIQRAAIAIDAVASEQLMQRGVQTANDMNKVSPAITINNGGASNTSIFLRGVGNTTNNNYLDPTVTPSYDGVVLGRASGAFSAAFFDLERVEVLKGPQGILYGRNATGGAVNIIPKKPELGANGGGFTVSYGNYDAVNAEGHANLAVGDNGAIRVAAMRQIHDGYNRDGSDDLDRSGLRGQVYFEPNDNWSVRVGGDWTKVGGVGPGASYIGRFQGTTFIPASFDASEGLNTDAANAYRRTVLGAPGFGFLTSMNEQQSLDYTYWGVNAEIKAKTGIGEITVIPAYRKSKGESFFYGPAFNTAYNAEKIRQFSLEARLAGSVSMVDYVVGGFYFDEKIHNNNEFNQEFVLPIQEYDTGTKSWAAFGQLTAHVSNSFRLIGGARYTRDKKFMDGVINNFITFCGGPGAALVTPPASFARGCASPTGLPRYPNFLSVQDTVDWLKTNGWISPTTTVTPSQQLFPLLNGVGTILKSHAPVDASGSYGRATWKVSAEYDVGPENLLYATVESGYRAGGFQLAEGNPSYDPEFITAYSIGSKNRFFNDKLQVNLEAFLWQYKDQQIGYFTVDFDSGVLINRTANAGRSTIKGVDADIVFKPLRHTTLSAQVQYLDGKYDDLHLYTAPPRDNIACPSTPLSIDADGNPVPDGTAGSTPVIVGGQRAKDFNCSGNPLLFSPKWSINLGINQVVPLSDNLDLIADVRSSWRDKQWGAFEYLAFERIPSYWSTDINVTLRTTNGLSLSGYVVNIEGNRHMSRPQSSPLGFATSTYTPPRTYGLRLSAEF